MADDPKARVADILRRFFREPNDTRADAFANEIVAVVVSLTGGRDPSDSNRGRVTPAGQGAQSRSAGAFTEGGESKPGGYRSNMGGPT